MPKKVKVAYEVTKLLTGKECDGCDGDGVRLMFNTTLNKMEIQRCDECQQFVSDYDAWKHVKPGKQKRDPNYIRWAQAKKGLGLDG